LPTIEFICQKHLVLRRRDVRKHWSTSHESRVSYDSDTERIKTTDTQRQKEIFGLNRQVEDFREFDKIVMARQLDQNIYKTQLNEAFSDCSGQDLPM
ncbi:hypothetical protein AMECASPLE_023588, partial [Ameca splendens]